jgi:hypothetical protein
MSGDICRIVRESNAKELIEKNISFCDRHLQEREVDLIIGALKEPCGTFYMFKCDSDIEYAFVFPEETLKRVMSIVDYYPVIGGKVGIRFVACEK